MESGAHRVSGFLYALRREVLRNGTVCLDGDAVHELFLYALRREVLRNCLRSMPLSLAGTVFLYALRREVLRNPTPVDGSLTSMFGDRCTRDPPGPAPDLGTGAPSGISAGSGPARETGCRSSGAVPRTE